MKSEEQKGHREMFGFTSVRSGRKREMANPCMFKVISSDYLIDYRFVLVRCLDVWVFGIKGENSIGCLVADLMKDQAAGGEKGGEIGTRELRDIRVDANGTF